MRNAALLALFGTAAASWSGAQTAAPAPSMTGPQTPPRRSLTLDLFKPLLAPQTGAPLTFQFGEGAGKGGTPGWATAASAALFGLAAVNAFAPARWLPAGVRGALQGNGGRPSQPGIVR